MFYVYGMSNTEARRLATKAADQEFDRRAMRYAASQGREPKMSIPEYQDFVHAQFKAIAASDKQSKLTEGLSSPERAQEWMALSVKQDGGRNFKIMQRRNCVDGRGNTIMVNGKPQTELVLVYA